jgi:putative ABC transport system substrate-binding protein
VFDAAIREQADPLIVTGDGLTLTHRSRIVEFAAQRRLPAMYAYREFVVAGGLIAYGPNLAEMYRRDAYYVDRIAKGAKPADLPVEQPTKYDFVINLQTAQALGLTIPQLILAQATEIIQ